MFTLDFELQDFSNLNQHFLLNFWMSNSKLLEIYGPRVPDNGRSRFTPDFGTYRNSSLGTTMTKLSRSVEVQSKSRPSVVMDTWTADFWEFEIWKFGRKCWLRLGNSWSLESKVNTEHWYEVNINHHICGFRSFASSEVLGAECCVGKSSRAPKF